LIPGRVLLHSRTSARPLSRIGNRRAGAVSWDWFRLQLVSQQRLCASPQTTRFSPAV